MPYNCLYLNKGNNSSVKESILTKLIGYQESMVLIICTKNELNLTNRYWDIVPDRQKVWTDGRHQNYIPPTLSEDKKTSDFRKHSHSKPHNQPKHHWQLPSSLARENASNSNIPQKWQRATTSWHCKTSLLFASFAVCFNGDCFAVPFYTPIKLLIWLKY